MKLSSHPDSFKTDRGGCQMKCIQNCFSNQQKFLVPNLINNKLVPAFKEIFSSDGIKRNISKYIGEYRKRIYDPTTTILSFLFQMLSADKSCSSAVARVNADRIAQGLLPGSPDTGGYCKAREKLPEQLLQEIYTETAYDISNAAKAIATWKGRDVKVADGTTLTLADTEENRFEYGIGPNQQEGIGFPITRLVTIFSLFSGCSLAFSNDAYRGKGTGEHALLRNILGSLISGDIFLGDAYFASYFLIAQLKMLGIDAVFHSDGRRNIDFRTGERLGKGDHIVVYYRPIKPDWMTDEMYKSMPDSIEIRELKITIERPGFKARSITIISTLLEEKKYAKDELGELYRLRWMAELYFSSIKVSLKMDHIRSKTPEMVRKEITATLLAYNLIRKLILESAVKHNILPFYLSFKGTVQTLNEYKHLISNPAIDWGEAYSAMLDAIAKIQVGKRPNRMEPRAIKKRPKPFPRLKEIRSEAKKKLYGRRNGAKIENRKNNEKIIQLKIFSNSCAFA